MRYLSVLTALSMLALGACSDDAAVPASTQVNESPPAPRQVVDNEVVVRMGMLFDDSDPQWMGGGQIVRGTLSVGDQLQLLMSDGRRVGARIDAIKDDASAMLVTNAKAPAGVFLTFTVDAKSDANGDTLLVAPGSFADLASAKAFAEAATAVTDVDTASAIDNSGQ